MMLLLRKSTGGSKPPPYGLIFVAKITSDPYNGWR